MLVTQLAAIFQSMQIQSIPAYHYEPNRAGYVIA